MIDILYLDHVLVAVNKPAGLLVHPTRIASSEDRSALKLVRDQLGRWLYPVHRLDKPTSGALLFALSPAAASALCRQFERGLIDKGYLAVVRGYTQASGVIDHPLREVDDVMDRPRMRESGRRRDAVTEYRTLANVELPYPVEPHPTCRYSLLQVHPRTGRRHQIRRHMKHISHPLVGDTTYGKSPHNRLFRERLGSDRLLLAAVEIGFEHPATGERIHIVAPLDPEFSALVRTLGWEKHVSQNWLCGT